MTPARRRKVAQSLLYAKLFSPSGGLTDHVTKMERLFHTGTGLNPDPRVLPGSQLGNAGLPTQIVLYHAQQGTTNAASGSHALSGGFCECSRQNWNLDARDLQVATDFPNCGHRK